MSESKKVQSPAPEPPSSKRARNSLVKYGLARLGLFVVLTVLIQAITMVLDIPFPLVGSALFALLIAFPLSMLIFTNLRVEANTAVSELHERRKAHKQWIHDELARR